VARAAVDAGHQVDVFFASDGVSFLRPETLDAAHGVGTGSMREHLDALVAGGATLHASGLSAKARAITPDSLGGLEVTMRRPPELVELVFAAERVLTY
jgi:hypothetical protein